MFDRRLEIVILADAPCAPELLDLGARVEVTPTDFVTEKARFKARSLEYFRAAVNLQAENWVLHLDEESMVDENALRACVDFIEKGEYDFGQVYARSRRDSLHILKCLHLLSHWV